jgi:hypothetical protein
MPPLPDHTSPTLAAIHAKRMARAWSSRGNTFIGASEAANECARAIWYSFRWASAGEVYGPRMLRLFSTGDREERRILDDLAEVDGVTVFRVDPETGKQFRSEIEGYIVVKPDAVAIGLPEAPKTPHIVECKSANEKGFASIKAKGVAKAKPEHWLQMQLEMLGEGLKRTLYFLVNKNTDEEYLERVRLDAEAAHAAVARLITIAEAPRPPGKIHSDPSAKTAFVCRFCRHRPVCHEGAFARVTCRSCLHATPRPGGDWHCARWDEIRTPGQQAEACPAHLWIPDLVPGEQTDHTDETVTYRLPDGRTWIDGGGEKHPHEAEAVV